MYLSVCGSELLRDGLVTACAEGPCQADVPSCRSSSAALVCVCVGGVVLSAGGLLPAPFVHLCDSHTGFTDLHVAVSHWQPSNDQKVTFSPPVILRPTDFGSGHRTGQWVPSSKPNINSICGGRVTSPPGSTQALSLDCSVAGETQ